MIVRLVVTAEMAEKPSDKHLMTLAAFMLAGASSATAGQVEVITVQVRTDPVLIVPVDRVHCLSEEMHIDRVRREGVK